MNGVLFMKKIFYNVVLDGGEFMKLWDFVLCKVIFWVKLLEVSYGVYGVFWFSNLVVVDFIRIM